MKMTFTTKNIPLTEKMQAYAEKKLGKLDKGENVTVYYVSDGWCFAKCGKQYGFLYDKYVSLAN